MHSYRSLGRGGLFGLMIAERLWGRNGSSQYLRENFIGPLTPDMVEQRAAKKSREQTEMMRKFSEAVSVAATLHDFDVKWDSMPRQFRRKYKNHPNRQEVYLRHHEAYL